MGTRLCVSLCLVFLSISTKADLITIDFTSGGGGGVEPSYPVPEISGLITGASGSVQATGYGLRADPGVGNYLTLAVVGGDIRLTNFTFQPISQDYDTAFSFSAVSSDGVQTSLDFDESDLSADLDVRASVFFFLADYDQVALKSITVDVPSAPIPEAGTMTLAALAFCGGLRFFRRRITR